jgi:adenine-specific DNA-methyltransferase
MAAINVDVLKQLVGDATANDAEEKYGLNWHGKRRARQLALTPSTGTLRPCPEDSVDWDTTQNLMIEGDNLEVLKLLQKSYAGKVKLIYIDPPYNTGKDFVYPDNFQDSIKNYLELTGQVEGGAKDVIQYRGQRAVSYGLAEHDVSAVEAGAKSTQIDHEYILCFGNKIRGEERNRNQYTNPDGDPRGDWASANMVGIATSEQRPNLHYDLINPQTKTNYGCPQMGWRYDRQSMARLIQEDRILWPSSEEGRPRRKSFIDELESEFTGFSTIICEGVFTRDGTADVETLISGRVFSFPKPTRLISEIATQGSTGDDLVLDFFAGSGTTGHAIMAQNAADSGSRRYILVQLPEPLDPKIKDQKAASDFCDSLHKPRTIAELTKERLRRAGKKVLYEYPLFSGDIGFRVFKLDSTNIEEWEPKSQDLMSSLQMSIEHLKSDRSEADILSELLLKLSLDLCVPMEQRTIAGKVVHAVGGGQLMVCLAPAVSRQETEPLALGMADWLKELAPIADATCVFRDSAFVDDVAKSNLVAILEQHGHKNVRSL